MVASKRSIAHLIATNFYGGPEKQIVEHIKRVDREKYNLILISYIDNGASNEIIQKAENEGIRYRTVPMSAPWDIRAQWKLSKILREENIDLLCAHGYKATVMGWWVKFRLGIPVIGFSRGYTAEDKKVAFYEWLDRCALRRLSGVICVSEGQRRRLKTYGITPKRSWVAHNSISVDAMKKKQNGALRNSVFKRLGVSENEKMIVAAGRLSPEKGHKYLVDAVHKMRESSFEVSIVVCGEGVCESDLKRRARKLGVYDKFRFVGFRRDINDIFNAMDLLVLPSLTEGLPNVVLEAFACKKPVVATDVGGVPEVVEDGVNGFLVPPERPDLMAEAMAKILGSADEARRMGEAGYDTVKSNFNFQNQAKKLEKIYEEVLAS
ncbi:MAG TPA: glycosyltransferase family 1 protein [Nitrospirae bacterium]|nr:glycosyltransferase family 1 protein [Nitrospirota bacterium]